MKYKWDLTTDKQHKQNHEQMKYVTTKYLNHEQNMNSEAMQTTVRVLTRVWTKSKAGEMKERTVSVNEVKIKDEMMKSMSRSLWHLSKKENRNEVDLWFSKQN